MQTRNAPEIAEHDPVSFEGNFIWPQGNGDAINRLRVEINAKTGIISHVGSPIGKAVYQFDESYILFPGVIDAHVHAREDETGKEVYKESFESAGFAAVAGGVTAFADMPNNPHPPIDDQSYHIKRNLAARCPVDVLLYAGIGPRTSPLSTDVPYKVYMSQSVGELYFRNTRGLRTALTRYSGCRVAFHAESPEVLNRTRYALTHAARRPPEAEVVGIATALDLCAKYGVEPHICHLSTASGLELIREARSAGMHVTCEVTPHHLYFENTNEIQSSVMMQCNPPVRSAHDRRVLFDAFLRSEIDFLASDHAPHSLAEKRRGVSGITHLDTMGPFILWLEQQGVRLTLLLETCSIRPGALFTRYLGDQFGRLEPGCVGSITVLRRHAKRIESANLKTRAGWSPFEGFEFPGSATHTVIRGRLYENS